MDDLELLQAFVSSYLSGQSTLLSNSDLRVEPISDTLQLLAKTEGLVATAKLDGEKPFTSIRYKSSFWPQLHEAMIAQKCLPIRQSKIAGFYEYEPVEIPDHYHVRFTDSLDLLQTWWSYKKSDKQLALMSLLILHRGIWYPIRDVHCEHGTLTIQTSGYQTEIYPLDMLVWLQKVEQPTPVSSVLKRDKSQALKSGHNPEKSEKYHANHRRAVASHSPDIKRIGGYLIEAGLLSPAQVEVVLSDQELTGMRFGEILVSRGWLKSKTIEFLFQNVILPHRTLAKKAVETARKDAVDHLRQNNANHLSKPVKSKHKPPQSTQPVIPQTPKVELQQSILNDPISAQAVPKPSPSRKNHQADVNHSSSNRLPSIHDRETLATHDKLNLDDLPDWLEMDTPD